MIWLPERKEIHAIGGATRKYSTHKKTFSGIYNTKACYIHIDKFRVHMARIRHYEEIKKLSRYSPPKHENEQISDTEKNEN